MITEDELENYDNNRSLWPTEPTTFLCPKIYTTRTRRMSGEYQVVQGSRYKAVPLDPPIEFQVKSSVPFNLKDLSVSMSGFVGGDFDLLKRFTIPELDLGIMGTTAAMLRDELLKLNKKATVDTPMFINRLELIANDQ